MLAEELNRHAGINHFQPAMQLFTSQWAQSFSASADPSDSLIAEPGNQHIHHGPCSAVG